MSFLFYDIGKHKMTAKHCFILSSSGARADSARSQGRKNLATLQGCNMQPSFFMPVCIPPSHVSKLSAADVDVYRAYGTSARCISRRSSGPASCCISMDRSSLLQQFRVACGRRPPSSSVYYRNQAKFTVSEDAMSHLIQTMTCPVGQRIPRFEAYLS